MNHFIVMKIRKNRFYRWIKVTLVNNPRGRLIIDYRFWRGLPSIYLYVSRCELAIYLPGLSSGQVLSLEAPVVTAVNIRISFSWPVNLHLFYGFFIIIVMDFNK